MSIKTGHLTIPGSPITGHNPLPLFRDRDRNKSPKSNGTLSKEELELFGYEASFRILPYTMQDRYSRKKQTMTLNTIILENQYLRAEFLPEYGGRLYSLKDQTTGLELLYKNPVFQPANLAIRDAWFSGGIEWNIAQLGHTYSTCDRVFFAKVKAKDAEFLRMYDYERTRGLLWQIDFHLPEDAHHLAAHVTIINDQPNMVPMYWWTNIAVKEEPGCRVFSGTRDVLYIEPASQKEGMEHCFGRGSLPYLPPMPDKDASYPLNFHYASEYFFQNPTTETAPYEAIAYNNKSLFYERSTQPLRIRKMFCWGSHKGGRNWCDFLSLPGQGDYLEIQAGLAPTQLHGMKMEAESRISFTQIFGALTLDDTKCLDAPYETAQMKVAETVELALSAEEVLRQDQYYQTLSSLPCSLLLHMGTGFGALENIRRKQEGQTVLAASCCFPEESLTGEQNFWTSLILNGKISDDTPSCLPESYVTDLKYLPYLERYAKEHENHPLACLFMGTILYENGNYERAAALWKEALKRRPMPILYRNLAYERRQENDLAGAIAYMEQIPMEQYTSMDCAFLKEYFTLLAENSQWDRLFQKYLLLPDQYQNDEHLYLAVCEAAFYLEDWDFLIPAFQKEYASIREGATKITDIWFAYAQKHGIDPDELPGNLDLRMF